MRSAGALCASSTTCGSWRMLPASSRIAPGIVAEKSRFWRSFGQRRQDAPDVRQEAHVEHVVRFVEDERFDLAEIEEALLHQVEHATGAADDDLGTAAQRVDLRLLRAATEDRGGLDARVLGEHADLGVDLDGELARRREDEDERALARLFDQTLQDRQRERRRLAGARLGEAHDVAAVHCGRDGLGLDRPGFIEAGLGDGACECIVEPEVRESARGSIGGVGVGQVSSPPRECVSSASRGSWF